MILGIIIGVLLWQFFTLIVYFATKQCEEKTLAFGIGIWGLLLWGIVNMYDIIKHSIKVRKYVAMIIDPEGNLCYCKDSDAFVLVEGAGYEWNYALKDKYKIEDGWKEEYCSFGVPNIKYTPLAIAKAEGAYKVNRRIVRKVTHQIIDFIYTNALNVEEENGENRNI